MKELDKDVILGYRNVKTHYNAYKNDLMFTFYNRDKVWNICYNEIIGKWVTRYSWTPLLSDNIDNSYFSFDLLKQEYLELLTIILEIKSLQRSIQVSHEMEYGHIQVTV